MYWLLYTSPKFRLVYTIYLLPTINIKLCCTNTRKATALHEILHNYKYVNFLSNNQKYALMVYKKIVASSTTPHLVSLCWLSLPTVKRAAIKLSSSESKWQHWLGISLYMDSNCFFLVISLCVFVSFLCLFLSWF